MRSVNYVVKWSEDEAGLLWHAKVCRNRKEALELIAHLTIPGVYNVALMKELK